MESLDEILAILVDEGKLASVGEKKYRLTDEGREYARSLIRDHDEFAVLMAYSVLGPHEGESIEQRADRTLGIWKMLMSREDSGAVAALFMAALEIAVYADVAFAAEVGRFLSE